VQQVSSGQSRCLENEVLIGRTVYALDRLPEPSPDFYRVQKRAAEELGTTLHYRQIDVRDNVGLNDTIKKISDAEGRMDGLLACAGIQQETTALDYSAKDANMMFEVNITGTFMAAQAVAKEMIRWGNGGSMAFIASMSGSVANRVSKRTLSLREGLDKLTTLPRRAFSVPHTTPRKQV
jgi:NAD(P)-dependent dehydrogenase (short-subunit alcohol dehydrogenase family)